jgi:cystathionine beta-lyase
MAEICLRHGVIICADEIHNDLVYSGHRHIPIASLDKEIAQNSITLIAASKSFNIAGLKASAAIIPNPELRERYENARQGLVDWVSGIGNTAMMAAFQGGEEWLAELLVYLEANRDYLAQFVEERLPGIEMHEPEGTFLAWLDCRKAGIEGKPADFFRDKARVEMNNGGWFGQGGEGFVRLNFGCPRSMLAEALERIEKALAAA